MNFARHLGYQKHLKEVLLLILVSLISLIHTNCAHKKKTRAFSVEKVIATLKEQSRHIQTFRGKAWIAAPDLGSLSTHILIDRSHDLQPKMRLEAHDPFGVTHVLAVLLSEKEKIKLVIKNFDENKTSTFIEHWEGIPLELLADLILGIPPIPANSKIIQTDVDSFTLSSNNQEQKYLLDWPMGEEAVISGYILKKQNIKISARFSKFESENGILLPHEMKILNSSQFEIRVRWQERELNVNVPSVSFIMPKHL